MPKALSIIAGLVMVCVLPGMTGCDNQASGKPGFNLIFKYGVTAKNELDTFKGTYTKDLILDPSITIELRLSEEEMDRIYQKMVKIDFFNYPDEFTVSVPAGESVGMVTPHSTYYFKVEYNSEEKELKWEDKITNPDEKAAKLRELINLIKSIIESREEYKKLPEPKSGYLLR
jgi:hypothetical protein